jgi:chaperonin GroEL
MIENGIIDPLLVTKSALINAVSVATTILSTDCVINNLRTQ